MIVPKVCLRHNTIIFRNVISTNKKNAYKCLKLFTGKLQSPQSFPKAMHSFHEKNARFPSKQDTVLINTSHCFDQYNTLF